VLYFGITVTYGRDTKAQRHEGTKKAGVKRIFDAGFLCAFVPLCLCVPRIRVRICENVHLVRVLEIILPVGDPQFFIPDFDVDLS
jgi:hypothetical protein